MIITNRHEVSEDFRRIYAGWSLCDELADIAMTTESIASRTECPLFGRRDLPVWIPSEQYVETDAGKFLQKAIRAFKAIESYLASEHGIQRRMLEGRE